MGGRDSGLEHLVLAGPFHVKSTDFSSGLLEVAFFTDVSAFTGSRL